MNKIKYSSQKAKKAVEISSRIEGHKIPHKKTKITKRVKVKS